MTDCSQLPDVGHRPPLGLAGPGTAAGGTLDVELQQRVLPILTRVATAVFLFTDLEGSTRLWAEHPDEMGNALAKHDRLMNAAVAGSGGTVFKHTGDGICAVFPSVRDAVAAAITAQDSIGVREWSPLGRVRVRMAIHVGEAEPRGADWFGPALNRTARLMGIAHGGQVLLSAAAHELVADRAPGGVSFADLGVHRLRDLARAEHAWQVIADNLERSFPPLRSFDGFRGRLPSNTTSFVGRADEVASISDRLMTSRLVTLVGPGGVGKSRLAGQVAAELIDKFPDGAWMFELAAVANGDGITPLMTAAIGLTGAATVDARSAFIAAVKSWRSLLVVDNCEHLLTDAADLVRAILVECPNVVVLATSREPLRLSGEQVLTVPPLSSGSDAVTLFIDRADAVRASASVDGPDMATIERICARLDGLPLAIELAAARTLAMTPAEIERRLDQRFRLLASRAGGPADRHGSLLKVVDWSFDLLDESTQAFFCRLAVFAGSFDAEAAGQVCWPEDDFAVIDMLEDLVAKSLVTANPQGVRTAYRLLETMRQYGVQRLEDEQARQLRVRHAACFADLAARAWDGCRSPESAAWLERLNTQLDDLRAAYEHAATDGWTDGAMRIAGGLFIYNHTRRLPEIYAWVDGALEMPGSTAHPMINHVRLHQAYGRYMSGRLAEAEAEFAAVTASLSDDDPLMALAAVLHAGPLGNMNRWDLAAERNQLALRLSAQQGALLDYDRSEALWNLCAIGVFQGTPNTVDAEAFLQMARRFGNPRALAGGLIMCGVSSPDEGRGLELLAEARELAARSRDSYRYGVATGWLGVLQSAIEPTAMLRNLPDLVRHARSTGQRLLLVQMTRDCMRSLASLGKFEAIARLDGAGLKISARPALAERAIEQAKADLGETRYEALRSEGAALSISELESYLLALAELV